MNTNCSRGAAALVTAFALFTGRTQAQLPTNASMSISLPPGQPNGRITVNDPSNNIWVVQVSSNLATWTDIDVWKVHNGNFHTTILRQNNSPGVFYRAIFDPSHKIITDSYATSLLLPGVPFNYSHPA